MTEESLKITLFRMQTKVLIFGLQDIRLSRHGFRLTSCLSVWRIRFIFPETNATFSGMLALFGLAPLFSSSFQLL